jgi:superfamily I DNA/RNA helicase
MAGSLQSSQATKNPRALLRGGFLRSRTARRTGRESVLSRAKRDAVWPVFEEYRGQLSSRKLEEVDDAYREVADLLLVEGKTAAEYSAIVVDETQDTGPQALRLLRAMIPAGPNDLFFVGDGHQRIYSRHRAAMSKCGIDIRGRARKLYLNYRTTDEIRRQAVALLEGCEVDDGHDETRRYKSLSDGPAPSILTADGLEAAAVHVIAFIKAFREGDGHSEAPSVCVIASSEKNREALAKQVQGAGLSCVTITAQGNHSDSYVSSTIWPTASFAKSLAVDRTNENCDRSGFPSGVMARGWDT